MHQLQPIFPNPDTYLFVRIPRTASTSICHAIDRQWDHKTALEWMENLDDYQERWKFSVVRHPYDRFLSMFYFFRTFLKHNKTPDEWIKEVNFKVAENDVFILKSQADYLCDSQGNILVDFVGKVEEIDKAWKEISTKLGVKENLPRMRKSRYVKVPLNKESKKKLREYYARDFEIFGYKE